ncbi:MAG: DUF4115 domain-containing protein [Rhodospirillales bacterium]|nr:DUF4115 domain-containing protein [Rhodospirillales bacterium]
MTVVADTDAEQDQETGIGATLREKRLRRGLTLDNIAETLRVRRHFLQAIEEGRFEALPGPTYASGFVRAYADLLGMHSGEAERQFKIETLGRKIGGDLHFPSPESDRGVPKAAILFVSVLLLGLAYGGWYLLSPPSEDDSAKISAVPERLAPTSAGDPARYSIPVPKSPAPQQAARDSDTLPRQPEPAAQPAQPEPVAQPVQAEPAVQPAQPAGAREASPQARSAALSPSAASSPTSAATAGGDAPTEPTAGHDTRDDTSDQPSGASAVFAPPPAPGDVVPEPAAEAPPAAHAEESTAPGAGERIVLRAIAPSWIELRDRNGQIVLSKVLEAGKMLPVDGSSGLSLVTGNAGGLEIIVGSAVLPPLGRPGQVRRDIVLDPVALRPMAER